MAERSWVRTGVQWRFRPTDRGGRRVVRAGIEERERALAQAPLFADLPKRHRRRIAKVSGISSYRKGSTVVKEGAGGTVFFLILEGKAKVMRKGRTLTRLKEGDFFGEMSLLDGGPRTASVVAATPATFLTLSGAAFRQALKADPNLTQAVLRKLAARLRQQERPLVG